MKNLPNIDNDGILGYDFIAQNCNVEGPNQILRFPRLNQLDSEPVISMNKPVSEIPGSVPDQGNADIMVQKNSNSVKPNVTVEKHGLGNMLGQPNLVLGGYTKAFKTECNDALVRTSMRDQKKGSVMVQNNFNSVKPNVPISEAGSDKRTLVPSSRVLASQTEAPKKNLGEVHEITTGREIVVPGRTEKLISINSAHIKEAMVSLSEEVSPGVFLANSVVKPINGKLPLAILNINEVEQTLKPFTVIFKPISEFDVMVIADNLSYSTPGEKKNLSAIFQNKLKETTRSLNESKSR